MASNVGKSSFQQNLVKVKKQWTKFIKAFDKSLKSKLGVTIYTMILGVISSVMIFNLGSVTSSTFMNTSSNIVNSITKTDSYETTIIEEDVNYNTVMGGSYAFRNWNNVSADKQTMFSDGKYIYTADGYNHTGEFVLTKYDTKFNKKSTQTFDYAKYGNKVFKKFDWDTTFLYGNFYMAEDYYYLVLIGPDFGNAAKDDRLNAPGIRIVKLNKWLWVKDYYDISYNSIGATRPGGWSNMAIAVSPDGSELTLATGFDGFYDSYSTGVGTGSRHQIGLQLILDTKTMELKKKSPVWSTHTLGQHVMYDGEDRIIIDANDASPVHGLLLSKVSGDNFKLSQNKQVTTPNIGSYVYLNMNIGGVALSDNNYLTVYNTMDNTLNTSNGASHNTVSTEIRDIRVLVAPRDNVSAGTVITLHDYISTKETPLTQNENTRTGGEPTITALDDDNFLVMWHEYKFTGGESYSYQTTCYMIIDGDGNVVQDVIKDNTMWLNTWCHPTYSKKNNTVYWFNDSTEGNRTFYSLKVRV